MFEKITSLWSSTPAPPYDPTNPKVNPLNPQGLKPCCACPQTKSARDDCFLNNSTAEADDKCRELVANHLACMRGLGFKL
ncbi:cytochrome C oxidase copper chaperone-domain-containing protein [Mycena epipterygia]|nr:cytochrome C oxidase copper chaperone-domain-containing protein [Mycena epipterygia]